MGGIPHADRLITEEGRIRIGHVGRKRLEDGVPRKAR